MKSLQAISGPSPFAAGCPGALHDDTNITGHELETAITVNPANPRNIVATWKQDVGPFNGTRSDLVASSQDGGKTWTRRTIPGLTVCTGGTADAASDPWVSAGGDGTVYFSGLAADLSTEPPTTAVVASHSGDGGRTWAMPATVAPPLQGNETDAITGSPTLAGHAYMVWANFTEELPRTNTARVLAHDRQRRNLVAPRPDRPAGSVRLGSGSPASRPAQRNLADRLRTDRLGGRVWGSLRRTIARRGTNLATARGARPAPAPRGVRPSRVRIPPTTALPQRRCRPRRHRVHCVREQQLGDLRRNRRGQVPRRRSHLEQRDAPASAPTRSSRQSPSTSTARSA